MLVKTNRLPRDFAAFTCWPFIFIRPSMIGNTGLISHEMVHYNEQGFLSLFWLARYFLSKKFRLEAEVRAYKVQIACNGISIHNAANMLLKYKLDLTIEQAYLQLYN